MKSEKTKYKCVKCGEQFIDSWYNYYEFDKGKFVVCPKCGARLVIDFDFKCAAKLSDLYLALSAVVILLLLISSLLWSYESVGKYILYTGIAIGLPIAFVDDFIRIPEIFPTVKRTRELLPKNDT